MSLNTPLKNVRGLGSAKDGTNHFWWQRLTAIALVPLLVWVVIAGMAVINRVEQATIVESVVWNDADINAVVDDANLSD